jgi:hypothetical protein
MNDGKKLVVVAFYFSFVVVTSLQIETKKTKEKDNTHIVIFFSSKRKNKT